MRRLMIIAGVVAAGALVAAGASAGGGQRYSTDVTFDYFCGGGFCSNVAGLPVGDDWVFMGRVESPKRACRTDRLVEVFEKVDGEDRKMGSDRSDSRGTWLVRRPDYQTDSSVWYAKAPKKKLSAGKACERARSPEIAD